MGIAIDLRLLIAQRPLCDVGFAADDGFDPGFDARPVERDHAIERTVVGDGDGILARELGGGDQLRDAAGAVQQAVLGVGMEVDKHSPYLSTNRSYAGA